MDLGGWDVQSGFHGPLQSALAHVADYAYDGIESGGVQAKPHAIAEWTFVWPILAGKGLIDHNGRCGIFSVVLVKQAAFNQSNLQALEVAGRHFTIQRVLEMLEDSGRPSIQNPTVSPTV